eukprot:8005835-Pyramimonas_sp.AAC.1
MLDMHVYDKSGKARTLSQSATRYGFAARKPGTPYFALVLDRVVKYRSRSFHGPRFNPLFNLASAQPPIVPPLYRLRKPSVQFNAH